MAAAFSLSTSGSLASCAARSYACRASSSRPAAAYAVPQAPDPFSVATLLRRIGEDAAVRLSEPEREALAADLRKIEEDYFAWDASAASAPDLPRIARRWVDRANG